MFAGLGFWLVFYFRDLWWNYDEEGILQTKTFNWFGEVDASLEYSGEEWATKEYNFVKEETDELAEDTEEPVDDSFDDDWN